MLAWVNERTNEAIILAGASTSRRVWIATAQDYWSVAQAIRAGTGPAPIGKVFVENVHEQRAVWQWHGILDGERVPLYGRDAREAGWELVRTAAAMRRAA